MTNTKKVVAVVLTLLMIFSSVSAVASAFDPATEDGTSLTINAEIMKEVEGEWTAVEKVKAGDAVKVRVSLGTDYYSNASTLLFFYDNAFFSDSYSDDVNALTVNDTAFAESEFFTSANTGYANGLVARGLVDSTYLASHNFFSVNLQPATGSTNFKYDASEWLFEFDLTVKETATGTGTFFVKDSTVMSKVAQGGYVNVPKGPEGGKASDNFDMWLWNADFDGCTDSVTVNAKITLNPQGGKWADDSISYKEFNGTTGEAFTTPALTNAGKTLLGWYSDSADTLDFGPEGPTAFDEFEDLVLYAKWIDKVELSFSDNYDGGSTYGPYDVTPGYNWGTEHTTPTDPTRTGYEFRGWSTNPNESAQATLSLPETYASTGATYYAIWAKAVTMTFVDALTNETIGTVSGYAGDTIEETLPTAPSHDGYYLAGNGFIPAVPAAFPAENTTYVANFEAQIFHVTYTVTYPNGVVDTSVIELQYNDTIPTSGVIEILPGYEVGDFYWGANVLAEDQKMPLEDVELTATATAALYKVTFDANGGQFADESTSIDMDVAYNANITAPADPTYEGFIFKGWTPLVGELYVPQDMTFKATWIPVENTVTYYLDDEETVFQTYSILSGEEIEVPADPVKEGSEFFGWNTDPDAEIGYVPTGTVTSDLTYYAIFGDNAFSLIYSTDTDPEYAVITGSFGSSFTAPEDPEEVGKTFDHWEWSYYDDEEVLHENVEAPTTIPAYDMTAKAVFTTNEYDFTITYQGAGDDTPDVHSEKLAYGASYSVESPVLTGYTVDKALVSGFMPAEALDVVVTYTPIAYDFTIKYVYEGEDAEEAADPYTATLDYKAPYNVTSPEITGYTADKLVVEGTMPAENTVITVIYTANEYDLTITYKGAGELTPETYSAKVKFGREYTVFSPTVEGYTPDLAVISGVMDENGFSTEVTYTRNAVNVNFYMDYADGNSFVQVGETATIDIDQPIRVPTIDPKEGYIFSGWYVGDTFAEGTEFIDGSPATESLDLYAKFTIGTFEVKFLAPVLVTEATNKGYLDYTNATSVSTVNDEYGAAVTAPTAPTIANYSFVGWTEDACTGYVAGKASENTVTPTTTVPENGKTYYAVYERELVYLVVKTAGTASIDRNGKEIGTWTTLYTEESFDVDNYKSASKYGLWFVHVNPGFRVTSRSNPYTATYFDTHGDGSFEVVAGAGGYGTGSLIIVKDNVTGEVVEEFYVVIFGDVTGDTYVNVQDRNELKNAYQKNNGITWATTKNYDQCKMMAANINNPSRYLVNVADYNDLVQVVANKLVINPITGLTSAK